MNGWATMFCGKSATQDTIVRIFVRLVFFLALLASCPSAAHSDEAAKALFPGAKHVVDVVRLPDGQMVYLHGDEGPCKINPQTGLLLPIHRHAGKYAKHFERLFQNPKKPSEYFSIAHLKSDKSYGLAIFRYRGGQITETRTGRMRDPQFYQNKHGVVFVWSRHVPEIRWISATSHGKIELPLLNPQDRHNVKWIRPISATESADGTVALGSILDPHFKPKGMNGVLIFKPADDYSQPGTVKRVPMPDQITGPMCFDDNNHLRMINHDSMLDIDANGITQTQSFAPMTFDGEKLVPVLFWNDAAGNPTATWRQLNRSMRRYDVAGFEDGRLHRFATWNEDHWDVLTKGMNQRLYAPSQILLDANNDRWLTGCDGSLYFSQRHNKIKELDWRSGIEVQTITHAKIIDDDLWLFDRTHRNEITQRLNLESLRRHSSATKSKTSPRLGRWNVVYAHKSSETFARNQSCAVSLSGRLIGWNTTGMHQSKLPADANLRQHLWGVSDPERQIGLDSRGHFWIFDSADDPTVMRSSDGKWETIGKRSNDESPFQMALRSCLDADSPELEIGFGRSSAAIGSNRRIVYRAPSNQLAVFSAGKWQRFPLPKHLQDSAVFEVALHDDDVQATITDGSVWQISFDELLQQNENRAAKSDLSGTARRRPQENWHRVSSTRKAPLNGRPQPPKSWNWKDDDVIWRRYSDSGSYLIKKQNSLAIQLHDESWMRCDTTKTPLQGMTHFRLARPSVGGKFAFLALQDHALKIAVYTPPASSEPISSTDLGTFSQPGVAVRLAPNAEILSQKTWSRYRVDNLRWSQWEMNGQVKLPAVNGIGPHRLTVQHRDSESLSRIQQSSYRFSVSYSIADQVEPLVKQLDADSFAKRDRATRSLIQWGPAVRNLLPRKSNTMSLETRKRIDQILHTIDQQ
ncbi:hypothetical protein [Planctomycetes bacterium K23_9]|uniref:Uncharacterized protein n=1 Tax=Stieleria marina TaxID=1930275 RepID=A0A517NYR6_9BACT|nr:hypothetical protein K239x_42520 [Planctomycetes bacterium K23_9]